MGRGGKVNCKRNFKKRVRSKDKGSDDSDEDYVVEIEENASDDDSDDLGNSLDDYASEESFGSYVEEEEEEEEFRNVRSKNNKRSQPNGKIGDVREKSRKNSGVRRRRFAVYSDSDFMPSGSSDYEFTVSDEEREQVREASELYGELRTSLRSSSSIQKFQENGDLCQQGKPIARKGKEKVKEVIAEVGKQVCGICLSEEDKRRLRGTLNCCSHYFCFTCIMEWSKVESRCPLCKQRFKTITKNGRVGVGVDLRNVVIQVPKRDQVYQPSEEEIRSFIDPYENVICTECHEGGDDGLMLLCDLCDSPAHTYCVGLGRQVPEGNWYCDGCRPVALGSSSSQAQEPLPDQTTTSSMFNRPSPVANNREDLDPTSEPSPRLAFSQGVGNLSSRRFPTGDVQAASPVSGAGAVTLSARRQIHRHIQNLLSTHRMNNMASRADGISPANLHNDLSNPPIDQFRESFVQNSRSQEMGTSQSAFHDVRLQDHPSSSLHNRDIFSMTSSQLRTQAVQDPTITITERSVNLTLWPELTGINSASGHEQFHQCNSRPGIAFEVNLPPHRAREESQFYAVKEQLQSMVKSHLKSLSQDTELGHENFKDIARSSTHTILAACGLEHKRSEVQFVPPPPICNHGGRVAAGQTSIMKGFCASCFDCFVRDVVKRIMDTRLPQWLSLAL
ncbi:hypothetical protein GH714_026124 [Hevea brasiliensis]|uniref:RING-type domain-containing protein n=1 Tax=Hevea brasiliensis TaxID=3981 RepID=A0A6A6M5P6_HEVBR|nr:hypothetical protein GH714_026124 [Hevea brasiliensis]